MRVSFAFYLLCYSIFYYAQAFGGNVQTEMYSQVEYVGLDKEIIVKTVKRDPRYFGYRKLKTIYNSATVNDNIANVVAVYALAKWQQEENICFATCGSMIAGVGIAFAPITFGFSLIPAAPGTVCSIAASVFAHRYRKLKKEAKSHMKATLYPDLVKRIISLSSQTYNLSSVENLLRKEGINTDNMIR